MHRTDRLTRPSSNMAERLSLRLAQTVGHRPDLHIGEFRLAGAQMARLAIGYKGSDYGNPSAEDIETFVIRASSGRLRPLMETAKLYEEAGTAVVNVVRQREYLPYNEYANRFAKVGDKRYASIDGTQGVWTLEDNDGVPVLFREAQESLEDVLREVEGQKLHMSHARLAKCQGEETPILTPGCEVSYTMLSGESRIGNVMGAVGSDGYLTVQGAQGKDRIHVGQIHTVLKTADLDGGVKSKLERYFAEMFGDKKYAQDLVREASVTGDQSEFVQFLTQSGMYGINAALVAVDQVMRAPIDPKTGERKIVALGPQNAPAMVLAQFNGNGFEWQIDVEIAESALSKQ